MALKKSNNFMAKKIAPSELVLNPNGTIYHLEIDSCNLADTIILVGDPNRVTMVSAHFDTITFRHQNREMVTHTGTFQGKEISVISTGMGAGCIDIVINEIDALANFDLATATPKEQLKSLQLVRIGTCGILQPEIPIGSAIASQYAIGLDGLYHYYTTELQEGEEEAIASAFVQQLHWPAFFATPYCIEASAPLLHKVAHDMHRGITCTALGFFGPQGRLLRTHITQTQMSEKLAQFHYNHLKIANLEMESAPIYGLANLLGHDALTVCLGVANRTTQEFLTDYKSKMNDLIKTVLARLV